MRSGPRRKESETILQIALEKWEWGPPKAPCTHLKAADLEQPVKVVMEPVSDLARSKKVLSEALLKGL